MFRHVSLSVLLLCLVIGYAQCGTMTWGHDDWEEGEGKEAEGATKDMEMGEDIEMDHFVDFLWKAVKHGDLSEEDAWALVDYYKHLKHCGAKKEMKEEDDHSMKWSSEESEEKKEHVPECGMGDWEDMPEKGAEMDMEMKHKKALKMLSKILIKDGASEDYTTKEWKELLEHIMFTKENRKDHVIDMSQECTMMISAHFWAPEMEIPLCYLTYTLAEVDRKIHLDGDEIIAATNRHEPEVFITDLHGDPVHDGLYTMIWADRGNTWETDGSFDTPFIHWMVVNIPGCEVTKGDCVKSYLPSGRSNDYQVFVYKQHDYIHKDFAIGDYTDSHECRYQHRRRENYFGEFYHWDDWLGYRASHSSDKILKNSLLMAVNGHFSRPLQKPVLAGIVVKGLKCHFHQAEFIADYDLKQKALGHFSVYPDPFTTYQYAYDGFDTAQESCVYFLDDIVPETLAYYEVDTTDKMALKKAFKKLTAEYICKEQMEDKYNSFLVKAQFNSLVNKFINHFDEDVLVPNFVEAYYEIGLKFWAEADSVGLCGVWFDLPEVHRKVWLEEDKWIDGTRVELMSSEVRNAPMVKIVEKEHLINPPVHQEPLEDQLFTLLIVDRSDYGADISLPEKPYINWMVINVPGGHVDHGDEVVPYLAFCSSENVYVFLYRQYFNITDLPMIQYTTTACRAENRCAFEQPRFVWDFDLQLVGAGRFDIHKDVWGYTYGMRRGNQTPNQACDAYLAATKGKKGHVHIGELFRNISILRYGAIPEQLSNVNTALVSRFYAVIERSGSSGWYVDAATEVLELLKENIQNK